MRYKPDRGNHLSTHPNFVGRDASKSFPGNTLVPGSYTVTFDIGDFNNQPFASIDLSQTGLTVNGTVLTPVTSDTPTPAPGSIETWSLSYEIPLNDPKLGQTLGFWLVAPDTGVSRNASFDNLTISVVLQNVGIDIKPGSFPNSINLGSGGATPVAILGSDTFDVLDIDEAALTLGTAGIKTVGKKAPHLLCSIEDVSGDFSGGPEGIPDGFLDLVCHFVTVAIVPEAGDTDAKLSGNLLDGTPIEGSDSVNIVP